MNMKHKVAELEGALLDAAVAKALGGRYDDSHEIRDIGGAPHLLPALTRDDNAEPFTPTSEWAHGGPIIERERISVLQDAERPSEWLAGASLLDQRRIRWGNGTRPHTTDRRDARPRERQVRRRDRVATVKIRTLCKRTQRRMIWRRWVHYKHPLLGHIRYLPAAPTDEQLATKDAQ